MDIIIEILKSIALGLVQGLGEFLPISSSGHLLLLERIFGISEGGRLMTIMLHVATLAAVCIVYRSQIWDIIKHPLQKKTLWLILATLVTVAITLVFKKVFDSAEDGRFLGFCFLATAVILTVGELARRFLPKLRTCNTMKWHHALFIGAMQGVAVFPGVSRSGSTITGALLCGVKKDEAAEFSFLLSIPAILGGLVLELPGLIKNGTGDFSWYGIIIGMLFAGVSGYFAVRFMLKLIKERSFIGFIIYTGALGIFLILNQFVLHLF